jgi:transposase-like protein
MGRNGRAFSAEFKQKVIQAVLAGQSQATVARTHNVSQNTIGLWLKAWRSGRLGGEPTGAPGADTRQLVAQLHAAEEHIAQLERLVGKKEAELDLLKKLDALDRARNSGSYSITSGPGRLPGKKRAR